MKKQIIVSLLPLVFACGCKTAKKATDDKNTGNVELITSESFRKPVKDKELFKTTKDAVLLDTVYITQDTLNIFTKKIQGCDADNFTLIWSGDLGKALPPQTGVKLFQLVDPACRERHKFHLVYNISPLKLSPKADTSGEKITLIRIGGWNRMDTFNRN